MGDRLSQAVTGGSTTEYLLDLNSNLTQVLSEYTQGATTPDVNYLHGHDIIGQQRGTTWHYFGYDGLGSNRFMMNSAGALTYSALYDPYGQVLSAVGPGNTNLGFTGEHTDPSGLQYLRARYYDPRTAAFLSRDPALGVYPTLSGSWNGYTYAHGNPILYADPSGQCIFFGGIDTALCAAAGLFLAGGAIDVGAQMLFEGRSIHQIDKTRAAISGATTVIGGGAGFASGALIRSAGLSGARALAVGGAAWAADVGTGIAADHYLLGDSWGTAILGNALGFGLGEVAGYAAKGIGRNIGRAGRSAGQFAHQVNRNLALLMLGVPSGGGRSSSYIPFYKQIDYKSHARRYHRYWRQVQNWQPFQNAPLVTLGGLPSRLRTRDELITLAWQTRRLNHYGYADKNVGIADYIINEKRGELWAVSGGAKWDLPGFAPYRERDNMLFGSDTFPVNGLDLRYTDSEAKILEQIARDLMAQPDPYSIRGVINLYTDRKPCPSCSSVITRFGEYFPSIELNIVRGPVS